MISPAGETAKSPASCARRPGGAASARSPDPGSVSPDPRKSRGEQSAELRPIVSVTQDLTERGYRRLRRSGGTGGAGCRPERGGFLREDRALGRHARTRAHFGPPVTTRE